MINNFVQRYANFLTYANANGTKFRLTKIAAQSAAKILQNLKNLTVRKLFTTLTTITLAAEHLAVVCNRTTTFHPRRNMVRFHLFDVEMLAAKRTNAALALIDFTAGVVIERTDTQMVDVMVKDIVENARLLLHIAIAHET